MGTRALISIDGKPMIATHWDGYPDSLGRDLLKCERCLPKVIEVAKKHSIDSVEGSIREELNNESIEDREVDDISNYRDWAQYEYNIVDRKVYFRKLNGPYPTSVRNAGEFTELR